MQERSRKKRPEEKDANQLAASVVAQTTQGNSNEEKGKNPAAVTLGRLGGLKGGKARANTLSSKRRREIAIKAAKVRWAKTKKE